MTNGKNASNIQIQYVKDTRFHYQFIIIMRLIKRTNDEDRMIIEFLS